MYHIIDSVSLIRGRHTLKFGAEIEAERELLDPSAAQFREARSEFTGKFTRRIPTTLRIRAWVPPIFCWESCRARSIGRSSTMNSSSRASFTIVQDDFKVSKKLTLNLGSAL